MPDTIYALSTGVGKKAAVAIVRVSGPECLAISTNLCPGSILKDRQAKLISLKTRDNVDLDRAIVIKFSAPRSYTGEEMLEFQVTGSQAIVTELIHLLGRFPSTRPAEAGEFAKRAFENGKLDLIEVEGLAAVLSAETSAQLRHSTRMTSGSLSRECEEIRGKLLLVIAYTESMLDFSDVDDASTYSTSEISIQIAEVRHRLHDLLAYPLVSERLRDGMVVVIAGKPNVGKSSLLNYLSSRDVAIVSSIPGTTRDCLEVAADVFGFPVTFVDTAGLRTATDPVEAEGVARALQKSQNADLILGLYDDESEEQSAQYFNRPVLRVKTKSDLVSKRFLDNEVISISTKTGQGIEDLLSQIGVYVKSHFEGASSSVLATERQRAAVRDSLSGLDRIFNEPNMPLELISEELRHASIALGRISGRIDAEEVLSEIFGRLCVGK